jgi:hypothetical protein
MPLRDHFHPPITDRHSCEGFHATWPVMLVNLIADKLPEGYSAEPKVRLGRFYEIDVGAFENEESNGSSNGGGVATLPQAAPKPTLIADLDIGENYEYEENVYDITSSRTLVAAVEFVSPGNKDRPEHRLAFVAKCLALLMRGVRVSIIDPVTTRGFNLYAQLLEMFGRRDAALGTAPPNLYGVTCRTRQVNHEPRFESWFHPLQLGQSLPELPLWLRDDLFITLELEDAYEQTCRTLRIA